MRVDLLDGVVAFPHRFRHRERSARVSAFESAECWNRPIPDARLFRGTMGEIGEMGEMEEMEEMEVSLA